MRSLVAIVLAVVLGCFAIRSASGRAEIPLPVEVLDDMMTGNEESVPGGMAKSRVKKGGAIHSSSVALPPSEGIILQKRRANNRSDIDLDSYFTHYPLATRAKDNTAHHHRSDRPAHEIKNTFTPQEAPSSQFYYFNEDLPATRVSHGYDPLIKLTNVGGGGDGDTLSDNHHEARPSKRQSGLPMDPNQSLWKPIFVHTKYGPFHLHIPITNEHKHPPKLDVQAILEEATRYKNPLDFDYASLPLTQGGSAAASHHLVRKRRGLGSWLKQVLHIKKKTTTPKPHPPPPQKDEGGPTKFGPMTDYNDDEGDVEDDSADFYGSKGQTQNSERGISKKVRYHPDQHGDTEIDWLLPNSLRKSSILARLHGENEDGQMFHSTPSQVSQNRHVDTSEWDFGAEQAVKKTGGRARKSKRRKSNTGTGNNWNGNSETFPAANAPPHYDSDNPTVQIINLKRRNSRRPFRPSQIQHDEYSSNSGNPGRRKHKYDDRYDAFDANPESSETEHYSSEDSFLVDDEIGKPAIHRISRKKRDIPETVQSTPAIRSKEAPEPNQYSPPSVPITKISLQNPDEPIPTASKEELRLLHELFINIVNGKCPQNLEARFVETYEMNLFKIIDSTPWSSTQEETSSEISSLIHQLVNCSIHAETEKEALQMILLQERYKNYNNLPNEIEIEMGGPLYRSKRGRFGHITDHLKLEPISDALLQIQMSNFEFALISFVSEECRSNVSPSLLYSAAQLILEAIHDKYTPFIPFPDRMLQLNLNIIQNCANLIMKHRQGEMRLKRKLQDSLRKLPRAIPVISHFHQELPPEPSEPSEPQLLSSRPVQIRPPYDLSELEDTLEIQRRAERKVQSDPVKASTLFNFEPENKGLESIFQELPFPFFESDEWKYKK